MINTKGTRESINYLSNISDLMIQQERQVNFWRSQARAQMKKRNKLQKEYDELCTKFDKAMEEDL